MENPAYGLVKNDLIQSPKCWLITGVAGFIGSNLARTLLELDQYVIGMDNFSTGSQQNLDELLTGLRGDQFERFSFYKADICRLEDCIEAFGGRNCEKVDYVLHHAAMASVPESVEFPIRANEVNVGGFLNVLTLAKDAKAKRVVFASSSAVYGNEPELPKTEAMRTSMLSPYAVSKYVNELYAENFYECYGLEYVGLRYFNIFGRRQGADGAYASVIPKWSRAMLQGHDVLLFGDGSATRDFCHVENVVQANLLAATVENPEAVNQIYNVANGDQTNLLELFDHLKERLDKRQSDLAGLQPKLLPPREGDVLHSAGGIEKAQTLLEYQPVCSFLEGLDMTIDWYVQKYGKRARLSVVSVAPLQPTDDDLREVESKTLAR